MDIAFGKPRLGHGGILFLRFIGGQEKAGRLGLHRVDGGLHDHLQEFVPLDRRAQGPADLADRLDVVVSLAHISLSFFQKIIGLG